MKRLTAEDLARLKELHAALASCAEQTARDARALQQSQHLAGRAQVALQSYTFEIQDRYALPFDASIDLTTGAITEPQAAR